MSRPMWTLVMIALALPAHAIAVPASAAIPITQAVAKVAQGTSGAPVGENDQDGFFVGARETVWTGRLRGDDKQFHDTPLSPTFAADLRKDLGQIQVSIEVDRKLQEARQKLEDLAIRATRRGYEGRKDVLVEVALARARLLETLNEPKEATRAVASVLVSGSAIDRYELAAATQEDKDEASKIDADPRMAAARAKLAQAATGSDTDPNSGTVDQVVLAFLHRNDANLAAEIGLPAVPTLQREILKNLDELPQLNGDALWHLMRISPARAGDFVLQNFDQGGPVWKARIFRDMKATSIMKPGSGGEDIWHARAWDEPPHLVVPQWRTIVERFLLNPSTAREALQFVQPLVNFDALDNGLHEGLARILKGTDSELRQSVLNVLHDAKSRPTAKPLFESLLSSSQADLRELAAVMLLEYETNEGLLGAVGDEDAKVRKQVAIALRCHDISKLAFNGTDMTLNRARTCPTIEDRERQLLARLVTDRDPQVRIEAATSISQLEIALDQHVYDVMSKDEDPRVRTAMLYAKNLSAADRARIAMSVATSSDPIDLRALDNFLYSNFVDSPPSPPNSASDRSTIDPAYYPVIEARRINPALAFLGPNDPRPQRLIERILGEPSGLAAMVRWVGSESNSPLRSQVIQRLRSYASGNGRRVLKPNELAVVDAESWAAFFHAVHEWGSKDEAFQVTSVLVLLDIDLSAQFLRIARDPSRKPIERLDACIVAANGQVPTIVAVLLDVLHDPVWKNTAVDDELLSGVHSIASTLPDSAASDDLDLVLADDEVPGTFGMAFTAGWTEKHALDERQAKRFLTRWMDLVTYTKYRSGFESVLRKIAALPRERQEGLLERASNTSGLSVTALNLIGDLHDAHYLGVLEQKLSTNSSGQISVEQTAALNALTRYFDDSAADLILKVAGTTPSSSLRAECFKALETIRKYQEEKGRWKTQRISGEAWDKSVHDLVELLDDKTPAVRAQAVRGLATLGAVQEMPRVVRMLKDPDESVRKAADEALATLNAPHKKD